MRKSRIIIMTIALVVVVAIAFWFGDNEGLRYKANDGSAVSYLDSIHIGVVADFDLSFDPRFGDSVEAIMFTPLLYSGLVRLNSSATPQPSLALSWEQPDDLSWIFYLRENAFFKDDSTLDARDVKYTFDSLRDHNLDTPLSSLYSVIDSVEIIGDYTVQFNLNQPYAPFIYYMDVPVVPENCDKDSGWLGAPFGVGPYLLQQSGARELRLQANPYYFGNAPNTKELVFHIYDNDAAMFSDFKAGEIDLFLPTGGSWNDSFVDFESVTPQTILSNDCLMLVFSQESIFFTQRDLRLALTYLVDKQAICEEVHSGLAKPAANLLIPGYWYFQKTKGSDYNTSRASSILTKAGWIDTDYNSVLDKDGEDLRFNVLVDEDKPEHMDALDILIKTWEQQGIVAEIEAVDDITKRLCEPWDYDVALISINMPAAPDYTLTSLFSSDSPDNIGGYTNAELDRFLKQVQSETNHDARLPIYGAISDLINAQVFCLPIANEPYTVICNTRLDDFTLYPNGSLAGLVYAHVQAE